jgi:hypothetical protein
MPHYSLSKLWHFIATYRYYFIILVVYFIGFLLITPLSKFNPGVPHARSYSLVNIDRWDDTAYYMIGKSAIIDGDLDYSNEQLHDRAYWNLNGLGNPRQGEMVPIGPSILWAPFIFLAHIVTLVFNFFSGEGLPVDGYASQYLITTCVGSSIYAFLSLLISYKILTSFFSPRISLLSVLTVFWGNSLIYNAYVRMLMSHAPEAFAIVLFVFFFLNIIKKGELSDCLFFGIASGLLVIVRYDNAMFLIMPLLHIFSVFWSSLRSGRWDLLGKFLSKYALSALIAFLIILPQFIHYYIQSGTIIPKSLGGQLSSTFNALIQLKALFFSETRNILWGQPIIIIGLIGSFLFIKENKLLGIAFTIIIIFGIAWLFWRPHVYWWGMDFGIRHLIKLSLPLAFGYAAIMKSVNIRGKTAFFSIISCGIVMWEYLKIIQTPAITPILKEGFLKECAFKIPDLVTSNFLNVLTGTECSYLKVLITYGIKLKQFSSIDFFYLIILPLSVLGLFLFFLRIFIYCEKGCLTNRIISRIGVGVVVFFVGLSVAGLAYPKKPQGKIYNDFKRGAVLAYDEGYYDLSLGYLNRALAVNPDGDGVIRKLLLFIKGGYYDFGTDGIRKNLKSGWSTNEGEFVWAVGRESEIELDVKSKDFHKTLVFRAMPYPTDQVISVILNGQNIGNIEASPGWREYRLAIDPEHLRPGKNHITFKFKHAKSPAETGGRDSRKLAMAFDWLRLEAAEAVEK